MAGCNVVFDSEKVEIWNDFQKITFWKSSPNGLYTFQTYVYDTTNWRQVSSEKNVLVNGPSFDLAPDNYKIVDSSSKHVSILLEGKKEAVSDLNGQSFNYCWDALVETWSDNPWFHFKVTVHMPKRMLLQMYEGVEPQILIDLGPLPPYERGHFEWGKTHISNPTVSCHNTFGNDFPGLYFWDNYKKAEIIMFFDMTVMNWMSPDNIRRFLHYQCSFLRDYKERRYKVGFWATGFNGKKFPSGDQIFDFWLFEKHRPEGPSEQEAIINMVQNSIQLISPIPSWPEKDVTWTDFAEKCLKDIIKEDWCWIKVEGLEGFRAYVKGTSRAWQDVFPRTDFTESEKLGIFETLDVLHPLMLYSKLPPNSDWKDLTSKLTSTLNVLYSERKVRGTSIDVWGYLYGLNRLWWFAYLSKNEGMLQGIISEIKETKNLARNVGYLFPLFFNIETMDMSMSGTNIANGGLYAYNMLLAYKITEDPALLEEAKNALNVMFHAPTEKLFHEPIELSFGALAASLIHTISREEKMLETMKYLLCQELRMFYWYDDNTLPSSKHYDTRGMVQACASMLYPALFENVISILPSTLIFKFWEPYESILRLINLQRVHNFYMFPACLPEEAKYKHDDPCEYVPFENLQLLEAEEETGYIGKEIYGAGETLWLYLMFEALAKSNNRDIMILNLDCLDPENVKTYPPENRSFLIYNPIEEKSEVSIKIPYLGYQRYNVSLKEVGGNTRFERYYTSDELLEGFKTLLNPRDSLYLSILKVEDK